MDKYKDYEPEGLAKEIFQKRYAIRPDETFSEAMDRVAYHVSQAENGENITKWRELFSSVLKKNLFFPGGRIMYGSGRPKGQLLNCFVIPTSDSREGWGKTVSDMIVTTGTGGGLGINGSPIRPRGTPINGTGGKATGAVSLFTIINSAGEVIKAGGGRRTALMLALELEHGDILEFLDEKLDHDKLKNANVSVIFKENPETFFEKVKKSENLELKHNGKIVGEISAKEVWEKIIRNALKNGEPGVLNGFLANRMNSVSYYLPLICTNPCGEIWLCAYDCCCLGSLVLPRFVKDGEFDWKALRETVHIGARFLDNVLTVNNFPLPEIKDRCSEIRRIGLGVTGLHDMLLLLGLKYSSSAGIEMVDKVMKEIKNEAYEASTEIAKEKGSFPKFNPELFLKGGFVKTLKPSIREKILEHGIRNCALLTIPPVGTGSMVCAVSSGIEPMFAAAYKRKYRDGDRLAEEVVIHPLFKEFMDSGRSVKHFQGSHELKMSDHFEMQRVVQKHIDNAVSKTINIKQGTSEKELSDLYMEYLPELKGVTVYPEGSRQDQPLTPMDLSETIEAYKNKAEVGSAGNDSCKDGKCDL